MKIKKNMLTLLICIMSAAVSNTASSQVLITGPTCVIAGTTYTYYFQSNWDSASTVQLCLIAGILADSNITCTSGTEIAYAKIIWSDTASSGTINITAPALNTYLNVSITTGLIGGQVDSAVQSQTLDTLTVPSSITCAVSTGGNCSAVYQYQWQQSNDDMSWTDIDSATVKDLAFTLPVTQSTFYRRRVTEVASGSIAYSTEAAIMINY